MTSTLNIIIQHEGDPLTDDELDKYLIHLGDDFSAVLQQLGYTDPSYVIGAKATGDEDD